MCNLVELNLKLLENLKTVFHDQMYFVLNLATAMKVGTLQAEFYSKLIDDNRDLVVLYRLQIG